jgi:oligopeptide/dipeptide ABC transporter ATP-binding protein
VVAQICDRVAVMLDGRIVETGSAKDVYAAPRHPYTRLLLDSVPVPDPTTRRDRRLRPVTREDAALPVGGCRFRPRCGDALPMCADRDPMLREFEAPDGQIAACWLYSGAAAPTLQSR